MVEETKKMWNFITHPYISVKFFIYALWSKVDVIVQLSELKNANLKNFLIFILFLNGFFSTF